MSTTRSSLGLLPATLLALGCAAVDGPTLDAGQPDTGVTAAPAWQASELTTTENLLDLYGTRISDVWAVGAMGVIFHFDGLEWTQHHSPSKHDLHAVWSAREGGVAWAVGAAGEVVRFDGEHWFLHEVETTANLNAIWGSGPNDVWVVGDEGTVMRYDGQNWIVDRAPTGLALHGVWGTSSRDLYVVGVGEIFHYDGKGWDRVHSSGVTTFVSIWGTGPDNIWVLGDRGAAHRFDGRRWAPVEIRPVSENGAEPQKARETTAIWGSAPDDVWAIGRTPIDGESGLVEAEPLAVLHFDGAQWTVAKILEDDQQLHDIWASGPNDVWTIGDDGLLLRYYQTPSL